MTTWWTDFSQYSVGPLDLNSDWQEMLVKGGTREWEIKEDATATGGKLASFDQAGTDDGVAIAWLTPGQLNDCEVLSRVRVDTNFRMSGVCVRLTEGGCYWASIRIGLSSAIWRFDSAIDATTLTTGPTQTIDTYYWIRFRCEGTLLKAKIWEAGTTEPETGGPDGDGFQLKTTDSTYGIGYVGVSGPLGPAVGSVANRDNDVFSVGTLEDPAPLDPPEVERASGPYKLYLHRPRVVLSGQVNQTSFEYPISEVAVDNLNAPITDAKPGQTVVFGTQPGYSNLGRHRIKKLGSGSTLFIPRSGQGRNPLGGPDGGRDGEVDLENDAYFEVWDDRRVWAKIPAILPDGAGVKMYKDGDIEGYDKPPPVANGGSGVAVTTPTGEQVEISFSASKSFATHDGATITNYEWGVGDGAIVSGTVNSVNISLNFFAGFRYVSLTVTDSESSTHTTYIPVYVRDPNNDLTIHDFEITRRELKPEGQTVSFRIWEEISWEDIPDGTLVMLWEGEPSFPGDRSHMRFIGWHNQDPGNIQVRDTGTLKDVVLECHDVAGRLSILPGFSQVVENTEFAFKWTEMTTVTMDKFMHYLLHWHSTTLEVAPWEWSGTGFDYAALALNVDPGDQYSQIDGLAQSMIPPRRFTCNSRGELRVLKDPIVDLLASRTATVQASWGPDDWSSFRALYQRPPKVGLIKGGAVLASHTPEIGPEGDEYPPTIFCKAPGLLGVWGQGIREEQAGNHLAPSQSILNEVIGHMYARFNALNNFFDIDLDSPDYHGVEPADMTWVELVVPPGITTPRGRSGTARALLQSISENFRHEDTGLVRTAKARLELETRGVPAITDKVGPEPSLGLFIAVGSGVVASSIGGLVWQSHAAAAANWWRSVVWSPQLNLLVAVSSNGTGNRVMTSPDGETWTSRTSSNDADWRKVAWSPELGRFVAVAGGSGTGNRIMTSTDGITWTGVSGADSTAWNSVAWSPGLGLFVAVGDFGTNRVMRSVDGINWTLQDVGALPLYGIVWSPSLGIFCVSDNNGNFLTSPDGIVWTSRTGAAVAGQKIAWSPSLALFCAIGQSAFQTSPDGITWTSRTPPGTREWNDIAWSSREERFVSVASTADQNNFGISSNGTSWSFASDPVTGNFFGITFA